MSSRRICITRVRISKGCCAWGYRATNLRINLNPLQACIVMIRCITLTFLYAITWQVASEEAFFFVVWLKDLPAL